jgi:transcriptional regulator with GAF, ATPase, and Fis domain
MKSQNYLKSVNRTISSPAEETGNERETFCQRIEELSDQAVDIGTKLQALAILILPLTVPRVENGIDFYAEVRRFEVSLIRRAMKYTKGSQTEAARLLKMNCTTLNSKIKVLKITLDKRCS